MDEFERGALTAISVFIAAHDEPALAADILKEMSLCDADCRHLDEYDKHNLRKVQGERGGLIQLSGLDD